MNDKRQSSRDIYHAIENLKDALTDDGAKDYHIKLAINLLQKAYDRERETRRYDDK